MTAAAPGRPRRILLLYEVLYPDHMGGVEIRNHELARALAERGHRVTLAGFSRGPVPAPPGVSVLVLGARGDLYRAGRRSLAHALRFARAALRLDLRDYDVVETASVPFAHLAPLAARCRRLGTPLVVSWYEHWGRSWTGYAGPWIGAAYQAVERVCAPLGDVALVTSELTGARLRPLRGGRATELLGCGVDTRRVARRAGLPGRSAPPIVFVGRLLDHKRLDMLFEAIAGLAAARGSGPLLTVLGEGPERERLGHLAAALGLAERIRFVSRVETSDDVYAELAAARVAVQPSAREGFGLFPLEALAAGLPVVYCTSPHSAVAELVRDRVEGMAVPPDPRALAAALAALLDGDEERARLAAAARARAAQFDWKIVAARFEEIALARSRRRVRG